MARRSDRITARNVFYIITNGEQTEYNYFKLLKAKRSVYDVKIIFENADPLGLVQYAQRYIAEANQVWCVFDIDYSYKDKRLIPALKQAEEIGIKIAYSNTHVIWDIERYSNLIVSILPAKYLPKYKEKTEKEIDEFLALLENINYEVETELFQVEVKTLYIQSKFILGNEKIENVVKTLNKLFERGKHLVGYDSVTLLRCC